VNAEKKVAFAGGETTAALLDLLKVNYQNSGDIFAALKAKTDAVVISDIKNISDAEAKAVREYLNKGGKILLLNSDEAAKIIFPEYITGSITPTEGDIVNMEVPESAVFDGIDLLELRYFNNGKREIPTVCHSALQINRHQNVEELANQTKIHGYINGDMTTRMEYVKKIKGFPVVKISEGKGQMLISGMAHEKSATDPIAARLLANLLNCTFSNEK
jgi:hypothetical protein